MSTSDWPLNENLNELSLNCAPKLSTRQTPWLFSAFGNHHEWPQTEGLRGLYRYSNSASFRSSHISRTMAPNAAKPAPEPRSPQNRDCRTTCGQYKPFSMINGPLGAAVWDFRLQGRICRRFNITAVSPKTVDMLRGCEDRPRGISTAS